MPPAALVMPPVNTPSRPFSSTAFLTPSASRCPKPVRGTDAPPPAKSTSFEYQPNAEIITLMEETAKRQNTGVKDAYMDTARKVCIEYNVAICDCYKIWKDMERLGIDTVELLSNKINHPTENMHWLFAFELFKTILQINI